MGAHDRGAAFLAGLRQLLAHPWLRMTVLGLSLAFLFLVLRAYWADMRSLQVTVRWWWVAASVAVLLPCLLMEVWLWRSLLDQIGWSLPLRGAAGVWFLSNLARYIPGNVWQFVGMMELGAASGIPRKAILASVLLHQLFSNLTGLLAGLPALANAARIAPTVLLAVLVVLVAGIAVALSPPVLAGAGRALNSIVRPTTAGVQLRRRPLIALFCGYCLYWVWLGTAFWLLGRGLGAGSGSLVGWASAFPASYVAGYLSLLTPSGVGVREGVLALLLAPVAGAGLAGVVALVARLWLTLAELLAAAVALAANRSLFRSARGGGRT